MWFTCTLDTWGGYILGLVQGSLCSGDFCYSELVHATHFCSLLHAGHLCSINGASGIAVLIGTGYCLGRLMDERYARLAIRVLPYPIVRHQVIIRKENLRLFI